MPRPQLGRQAWEHTRGTPEHGMDDRNDLRAGNTGKEAVIVLQCARIMGLLKRSNTAGR